MSLLLIFFTCSLLVMILVILPFVLENKNTNVLTEQISSFECGLDNMEMSHTPFSLRFFALVIIFIIFDIELVLLMPLIMMPYMNPLIFMIIFSSFMFILMIGVLLELSMGSLQWMN